MSTNTRNTALLVMTALLFGRSFPAIGEQLPQSATPAPPPVQQVEQEDRSKKNGAAAAMAAMGAAFAGMSCIMLMKQAQETQDPNMKAMLMSQAMQQCGQAAQSAANAAQNNDGKKKLTQPDMAALNQGLQTKPFEPPKNNFNESNSPQVATVTTSSDDGEVVSSDLPPAGDPLPSINIGGGSDLQGGGIDFNVPMEPQPLAPIPPGKLGYDESAGTNSTTGGSSTISGASALAARAPASTEEGKKLPGLEPSLTPKNGRDNRPKEGGEAVEGGGGGGGSEDGKGQDSLEGMLANLFGGGGKPMEMDMVSSGADIIALTSKRANEPPPNIFEYASYRYKKAAYEDGMLRRGQNTKRASVPRHSVLASSSP